MKSDIEPRRNRRPSTFRDNVERAAAAAFVALLAVVLWRADSATFVDQPHSPLYREVLEKSFSRFRESDMQVAARSSLSPKPSPNLEIDNEIRGAQKPVEKPPHESEEYLAAVKALDEGRIDEAVKGLRSIVEKHPKANVVRHKLADTLHRQDKWKEAINTYREVLQHDPDYVCCFEHMSDIFAKNGEAEMAARMMDSLESGYRRIARRPGDAGHTGRYNLARFLLDKKKDVNAAIECAQEMVGQAPDNRGLFLLAQCYERANRKVDARSVLDKIKAEDPESERLVTELRTTLEKTASVKEGQ